MVDFWGFFKSKTKKTEEKEKLKALLKEKYSYFQKVLNENNHVLSIMADLEEKLSGEYLFDMHYIKTSVTAISDGVRDIIENLNALSEGKYKALEKVYSEIKEKIERILASKIEIPVTDFTISLDKLDKDSVTIAGGKIAHLAELKNILKLPTPEGFSVTSYAFLKFLELTGIKEKISEILNSVEITKIDELTRASEKIQQLIINAKVPDEIANSIKKILRRTL